MNNSGGNRASAGASLGRLVVPARRGRARIIVYFFDHSLGEAPAPPRDRRCQGRWKIALVSLAARHPTGRAGRRPSPRPSALRRPSLWSSGRDRHEPARAPTPGMDTPREGHVLPPGRGGRGGSGAPVAVIAQGADEAADEPSSSGADDRRTTTPSRRPGRARARAGAAGRQGAAPVRTLLTPPPPPMLAAAAALCLGDLERR
jgi:hypothetical protein